MTTLKCGCQKGVCGFDGLRCGNPVRCDGDVYLPCKKHRELSDMKLEEMFRYDAMSPDERRKHDNRDNPCECARSKLTDRRKCEKCGGYQLLKPWQVRGIRMRIEWERQIARERIKANRGARKQIEKEMEAAIAAIQAKCKHRWGGFAEVYICNECGLTEIN